MIDRHFRHSWRGVLKNSLLLLLGAASLGACKPQAQTQPVPEAVGLPVQRPPAEVFRESTRRYLVVTQGTEASCESLLGPDLASVFTRQGQQTLCGQFKAGAGQETIKGRLDRVYGENITIPWEVSGDLLTAAFEISDGVEMPVFLFRDQRVVLFQLPERAPVGKSDKP